ncbi:MAG TPA: hypothetical protein VM346_10950 [Sphingomicrobium sp.]|nr:hypothetical protein [Sphingomicrobium sp.]
MRAILLVLILAVVAIIVAIASGLVDITQTRGARAPAVATGDNGVAVRGGQSPAFDIETGSVAVGTREANVVVPRVRVEPGSATVQVPTVEVRRRESDNAAAETVTP